jgi:hypothetical protein
MTAGVLFKDFNKQHVLDSVTRQGFTTQLAVIDQLLKSYSTALVGASLVSQNRTMMSSLTDIGRAWGKFCLLDKLSICI